MGLRDLIFGKEEEEENPTPPETKENPAKKDAEDDAFDNLGSLQSRKPVQKPPTVQPVVPAEPVVSSAEVEAELKALNEVMQVEKKEKGLGQEYYGFLKALGDESDADAYQRTLRTLNAVREQFAIGSTLTWKMLIDSAKSCMTWLSTHTNQKTAKLQAERQTTLANYTLQIQKAETAIHENEEKILRLQREIEEQKAAKQSALEAQKRATLEFDKKKGTIDAASLHLANEIATDIARFQREA